VTGGVTYALITGASKGLGKYFARALAARGQNLILVARSKDKLVKLAGELRDSHGILAEPLAFDLAAPGAGLELERQLRARNFPIELLVNNAGFGERGKFLELPLERQLKMIYLQNTAVVELTSQLLPSMVKAGRGGIINVSSLAGFQPVPYAAMYSATKSFLTTFSMALREELRPTGVKVVTVCPGRLRADPEDPEAQEKRQKVPGREQRHEDVVSETLKKLDSGGGLVIPGRLNQLTIRGQRLMSLNAVPKIVARLSKS
jgi:short-subunit dehydrogenase